jgi:hypothetical protein
MARPPVTPVRIYRYKEFYKYGSHYKKLAPLFDFIFDNMARLSVIIDLS